MNPLLLILAEKSVEILIPYILEKILSVEKNEPTADGNMKKEWVESEIKNFLISDGKKLNTLQTEALSKFIDASVKLLNEQGIFAHKDCNHNSDCKECKL